MTDRLPSLPGLRREPVQARSRARVEVILQAASELLAEGGSDALVLREVARRADVPIGSLYQYFADKGGILRALVGRYHRRSRELLGEQLAAASTLDELLDGLERLGRAYFALHRDEPLWREVLNGVLADRELQALNLRDSQEVGGMLAGAVLRCAPGAASEQVASSCEVIAHLIGSVTQLALAEPDPVRQQALVEVFERMARVELLWAAGAR